MSSVFKIYSPEDCDFYYDGELQGHIEGNSKKAFRFEVERKGVYRLEFINSEYQTELMMKVSIDADEEREVELDFSEVNEPVIRERIITAIEHDYGSDKRLPEEIISLISKDGIAIIPKGVRKIGRFAFSDYEGLTSITIPDSVTVIGDYAFSSCGSLTSITIPNSVTEIGDSAFYGCYNLTTITIPDSVAEIGESAFAHCISLTAFYGKYASKDSRCLIKDGRLLAFAPAPYDITKYTIPDSVAEIGECAFSGCESLTSITIPNSVTEIRFNAFSQCESLASITIPDSVTEIGEVAFGCCWNLTSIYCKATTPPILGYASFENNTDLKIYIPKSDESAVLEAYKSANNWDFYADIIEEYDFDNG